MFHSRSRPERQETRSAWLLCAPALLLMAAVALFPLAWTFWESLHLHDLRMPWRGRPFVGAAHYAEAFGDPRLLGAIARTLAFTVVSVGTELVLGLGLALVLHRQFFGRGAVRAAALLPWAIPTVVAALVWRFLFEPPAGAVNGFLTAHGWVGEPPVWLGDPWLAWVPILLSDIWKTTPFVALLLLAGLQQIDESLIEAARIDGAGRWRILRHVVLPLLTPALLVAALFRSLDALRVFDLIYVLSGGGPGTATEPVALYTFNVLLQELRFGYGAALSMLLFAFSFGLAWLAVRWAGSSLLEEER